MATFTSVGRPPSSEIDMDLLGVLTDKRSLLKSFLICGLILLKWGIPLSFVGVPTWLTTQAVMGFVFVCALVRIVFLNKYGKLDLWEWFILVFIFFCYSVTLVSNIAIFEQPFGEWGASLTYLFPLLLCLAARPLGLRAAELLVGLVFAALIASLLVVVDRFIPLSALDEFAHRSTLSRTDRRVVLMHNESAFALGILASVALAQSKRIVMRCAAGLLALVVAFSLIEVSESRLAIGGAVVGFLLYFLIIYRSTLKIPIAIVASVLAVSLSPVYFSKYIDALKQMGLNGGVQQVAAAEASTRFRMIEIEHYREVFEETHGLGFGLMTISPNKTNILSQSQFSLAAKYEVDYWMSLVDIRIYGALYQFGYVGLALVLIMTFATSFTLIRIGLRREHPLSAPIAAVGCTVAGFMISPLPLNLFTAENTILIGAIVYAVSALSSREERRYLPRSGPRGRFKRPYLRQEGDLR